LTNTSYLLDLMSAGKPPAGELKNELGPIGDISPGEGILHSL